MDILQYPLFTHELQVKTCTKCNVEKHLYEFHRDKNHKDGRVYQCKECVSEVHRQWYLDNAEEVRDRTRQWAIDNPEQKKENDRKWYEKNHEYALEVHAEWRERNPEYNSEYYQKWRLENLDRERENNRQWRKNNSERVKEIIRRFHENNPGKVNEYSSRRRARKASVDSGPKPTIQELIEMQDGKCAYCQIPGNEEWHMDHVIPISKGGGDIAENVVAACATCNRSKSDKDVDQWLHEQGYMK